MRGEIAKSATLWKVAQLVLDKSVGYGSLEDINWDSVVAGIECMKRKAVAFDTLMQTIYEEIKEKNSGGNRAA